MQTLDSRRIEERNRLSEPPVRQELVRSRKPAAVIGTSPGSIGTAVAQQQLKSVLIFCNAPQMNSPEAYIPFRPGLVGDDGEPSGPTIEGFLRAYMADFHAFIVPVGPVLPKDA